MFPSRSIYIEQRHAKIQLFPIFFIKVRGEKSSGERRKFIKGAYDRKRDTPTPILACRMLHVWLDMFFAFYRLDLLDQCKPIMPQKASQFLPISTFCIEVKSLRPTHESVTLEENLYS
ncbi:hypothetical protein FRX31_024889 [Thalictrum thalictroides]|uniref:Uncharacterized protein n=1 Tax=Thalictrum thalictroides TaxID=46969 RepID=A0A7J6VK79_THATH|nr:hypothetical protein FRX31_024889 [Thalictrum thalictroides]